MWPSYSVYAFGLTKFEENPEGSSIFCVDLTWNDPCAQLSWQCTCFFCYQCSYISLSLLMVLFRMEGGGGGGGGGASREERWSNSLPAWYLPHQPGVKCQFGLVADGAAFEIAQKLGSSPPPTLPVCQYILCQWFTCKAKTIF